MLDSVVKRIDALENRFENTVAEVHEYGVLAEAQEGRTGVLEKKLQDSLDRIGQLESRHCQNNLRLLNVPEGAGKKYVHADLPG